MFGVSVGLWAEYDVCGGFQSSHVVGLVLGQPVLSLDRRRARVGDVDDPRPAPWAAVAGAGGRAVHLVGDPGPVPAPELDRAVRARAGHVGRLALTVIGRGCGNGRARREVGDVDDREAAGQQREVGALPSLLTESECSPPVASRRVRAPPGTACSRAVRTAVQASPARCPPARRRCPTPRTGSSARRRASRRSAGFALPAKISARSGFVGSSQRKNSWVLTLNCVSSRGSLRVRARDVVEAEVADRRLRAVVQRVPDAAVRVQDDQDVLRPPDAQLARRLARLRVQRRAQQLGSDGSEMSTTIMPPCGMPSWPPSVRLPT